MEAIIKFGSILIIFQVSKTLVSSLTCSEIKRSGSGSKFSLEDLNSLEDDEFFSCLVYLGRDPLDSQEGKYLWTRLKELYENDIGNIPDGDLQQLGWIMRAIPTRDLQNLTLSDIDTISAFGQYHNLSRSQLQILAERVREDWNAKEPYDYTFYDLMALNHILCGFNLSDLAVIHPDSYRDATIVLSTLRDCPREPLEVLASLAVSQAAFKEPSTWHSTQAKSVGCVMNGMSKSDIASIPPEGMESLTPEIMICLHKETLRAMTKWQLRHLSPSAAAAVTHNQKSFLDYDQQKSINEAYTGETDTKNFSARPLASIFLITFLIL